MVPYSYILIISHQIFTFLGARLSTSRYHMFLQHSPNCVGGDLQESLIPGGNKHRFPVDVPTNWNTGSTPLISGSTADDGKVWDTTIPRSRGWAWRWLRGKCPRQCSSEVAVVAVVAGYCKEIKNWQPKLRKIYMRRRAFVHPKSAAVGLSFMVHSSMTHSRWCWWWRLDRCLQWTEGWRLLAWPHLASCPGRGRILVGRVTVSWDYLDSPKWQNREGQGGLWMFMVCKSVWKNVKDMRQLVCPCLPYCTKVIFWGSSEEKRHGAVTFLWIQQSWSSYCADGLLYYGIQPSRSVVESANRSRFVRKHYWEPLKSLIPLVFYWLTHPGIGFKANSPENPWKSCSDAMVSSRISQLAMW